MKQFTQLIAVSCVWAGVSTGAYFLGKSSEPSQKTTLENESELRTSSRRSRTRGSSFDSEASAPSSRALAARISRELRDEGPKASLERIFAISDPLRRGDEFRTLLDRLSPEEFTEFIDAFREDELARQNMSEYQMALYVWAQKDPLTALAYADEKANNPWVRRQLLASWSQYDLAGAESWALNKHDGEGANPYLVGIIEGIASTDQENATRLLNELPFSQERGAALKSLVDVVGKMDMQDALGWVEQLNDERLRSGALVRLADAFGRNQPEEAARWAESLTGDERQRMIAEVAEGWVRKSPEESVNWVKQLPNNDQIAIAADFVNDLARRDFTQARDWLSGLGDTPELDGARMSLAWTGVRSGKRDEAVAIFEEMAASGSPAAQKAQDALQRIENWQNRRRNQR